MSRAVSRTDSLRGPFGARARDTRRTASHGASSAHKVYQSSFIPGLHDVCMVFEKQHTKEGE